MKVLIYGIVFFILLVVAVLVFALGLFVLLKSLKLIKHSIKNFFE